MPRNRAALPRCSRQRRAYVLVLKLAQWDGKTARNAQSENLFLLRWLQTALKQKRFHRCVAHDLDWLIRLAQKCLITSKLKSRLEYLWRSCSCDTQDQSDLFRLSIPSSSFYYRAKPKIFDADKHQLEAFIKRGKSDTINAESAVHAAFSRIRTVTAKTRSGMIVSLRVLKSLP